MFVKTTSLWLQDINRQQKQHSYFNGTTFVQLMGKQDSHFRVCMRATHENKDKSKTAGQ